MSNFHKSASVASLLAALATATPSAAATFDGDWNVQITSSNAACSSGASVSIEINNGQVASNSTAVTASGRVADAGAIRVTLVERHEARSRLRHADGHIGIGHMARCLVLRHLDRATDVAIAFSSESLPRSGVDTGSREENASKPEARASVLIQSEPKL